MNNSFSARQQSILTQLPQLHSEPTSDVKAVQKHQGEDASTPFSYAQSSNIISIDLAFKSDKNLDHLQTLK